MYPHSNIMGDIPKDNTIIAVADSPKKLAIIELASKGEIIFDHASKMIIQLNELQKVYQQIIETQKRPIFIPHEKDTTLSRENINRLLVTLRGYSSEGQSI